MEEIKKRDLVIRGFISRKHTTPFNATNLESICLQVRKILELIALGSMIVNKEEFRKYHRDFHAYWHGGRILKNLHKINPNFYPKPVIEVLSSHPKIKFELIKVESGFLTESDFVKIYEKCGKILHAENPFGTKIDYFWYEKQIINWMDKIVRLLNIHTITLLNDLNMYLIHMQDEKDNKVHGYTFEPRDRKELL
jgi:hypothetical protein